MKDYIDLLQQYNTSPCTLHHEKVKLNAEKLPVKSTMNNESQYERVALCPVDIRAHRLGCAHSKANHTFLNIVDDLNSDDPKVLEFRNAIESCINEVYALDHEKGELEKDVAKGLDKLLNEIEKSDTEEKIKTCVTKHTACIGRLENVRAEFMELLNCAD